MEKYFEMFAIKDEIVDGVTKTVRGWTYPCVKEEHHNREVFCTTHRIAWVQEPLRALVPCKPIYFKDYWLGIFGFPRWKGSLSNFSHTINGLYTHLAWFTIENADIVHPESREILSFLDEIPELELTFGERYYLANHGFNPVAPWASTIIKRPPHRGYRTLSLV